MDQNLKDDILKALALANKLLNDAQVRHINSGKDIPTKLYNNTRNELQERTSRIKKQLNAIPEYPSLDTE